MANNLTSTGSPSSLPSHSSDLAFDWLLGGGEMGARIRAFDWEAHPLGPIAGWPQSLKTIVRTMLTSRYAMWMGWGPDYFFFCNDAYLPTLGIKQSWALGSSAKKVWAEIWPDIGPRADSVVTSGRATWDEALLLFLERSGYQEETYHTFSYSPIPGDDGSIGGMLCVVTEVSDRVISERRLALVRELASALSATSSEAGVFEALRQCLRGRPHDLPFALLYLFNDEGSATLAASHGMDAGTSFAPERIELTGAAPWPLAEARSTGAPVSIDALASGLSGLPTGVWKRPIDQVVVVPIGQQGLRTSAACLVAAINPYRRFDSEYRGFLELLASQLASGLANARAYEAERRRASALAELDRAKTEFFSNVSHEFRTPLTLMLGPLEDLEAAPLPEAEHEKVTIAQRNGIRLLRLVNTLLDFSRIEAGRTQASFEPVDLAALTADLASAFRSAVERAGMKLIVDCPPLPQPVYVDREMWEKIVLNLLSNAFKHTLVGEIRVTLRAVDEQARLSVTDTGSGIPAEAVPRLFERFFRVQGAASRSHEGSGIGLSLVQGLVKLHGGSIDVESELGKGSTFSVTLPLGAAHLPAEKIIAPRVASPVAARADAFVQEAARWLPETAPTPGQAEAAPGPSQTRPRILLADDNADMRLYIEKLLAPHYRVDAVADGLAALESVRRSKPDAVITDVMMPRLNGFEFLKAIRAEPQLQDVPVVMLSARAGESARAEGLEAGADDYMVKPFGARELLARVNGCIALSNVRRAALRREERLKAEIGTALEGTADAFVALDRDFRFTYVNREAERIYGRTRESVLGQVIWELFPDGRGTAAEKDYYATMEDRQPRRLELLFPPLRSWFEINVYPGQDGGIAVFFRDITRRKRTGAILDGQRRALEMAVNGDPLGPVLEVFVKAVEAQSIDGAISTILILDRDGRHLRHGAAPSVPESYIRAIDGIEIGPGVGSCGTSAFTGKICSVDDIASHPFWSAYKDLAESHGFRSCWSLPIVASNGGVLGTFAVYYSRPGPADPEDIEAVKLMVHNAAIVIERNREIEDRVAVEEALRTSNRELEQFAYISSHDLKEPLRKIATYSQLLQMENREKLDERSNRFMESITQSVDRMRNLIDDLLGFSRAGREEIIREPVNLNAIFTTVCEDLEKQIEDSGAKLTRDDLPEIVGDPTQIQQLIQNLISNALKFHGEKAPEVHMGISRLNGESIFSISDNGIGIAPDYFEQIFKIFQRLHGRDKYPGTGIGLAICRKIVERHHGRIWVESTPGKGSTFSFTLS